MVVSTLSTQKQDSSVLLLVHQQNQTRTLLFLQKRIQSTQTVPLQKTAMFGGKESDIQQRVTLLTGRATHAQHSLRTRLLRVKKWHIQTHALQHQQDSVHVSLQNGKIQRVYLFLQSSSVDAAHQQYLSYTSHAHGTTVYSSVLS